MSERSGVEIDYCPSCRGVWLDRGELDKIIERSYSQPPSQPGNGANRNSHEGRDRSGHDSGRDGHSAGRDGHSSGRPRKKESWLGDLFG
ncbi:hypothetical protein FB464_3887 [Subtercola boreus]|nr:hypothetical protein FB464_3887 [Subtercola boreus]